MIELKTEVTSHRPTQLPGYLELANHHHPTGRIDLTYLTPPMVVTPPPSPSVQHCNSPTPQATTAASELWTTPSAVSPSFNDSA